MIMEQLISILQLMGESFLRLWPYLLLTIPLAVAVNLSGAARHINRAFTGRPLVAILLATVAGAFSPFCSCGVIPVIAALLIGGVPLAPVMSFWIASPSMDPETFFLSVAMLGWPLAVWRLAGTLALSLAAGLITHLLVQRGWLGAQILRRDYRTQPRSSGELVRSGLEQLRRVLVPATWRTQPVAAPVPFVTLGSLGVMEGVAGGGSAGAAPAATCSLESGCSAARPSFWRRLGRETWLATAMVAKFMALAFLLEALIALYVPERWIVTVLGDGNTASIASAALLGVPVYTSNLTALPLIGGLLSQGMAPAAALAFLIAGPTTTLPAMAAVWGLVSRRVFLLYVALSLFGAVALGYAYQILVGLTGTG
jgi:uncharacterized protein